MSTQLDIDTQLPYNGVSTLKVTTAKEAQPILSKQKATPTQEARQVIQGHIYETLKDLPRSAKRGKLVKTLSKRYGLSTVTINRYFRNEAERLVHERRIGAPAPEAPAPAPDVPGATPEGMDSAQEYIKAIGGLSVDNFGHADPSWPWEGANVQIEQMTNNEVVIHLTVTISQEQMIDTILGLMTKSNRGFHTKLIG